MAIDPGFTNWIFTTPSSRVPINDSGTLNSDIVIPPSVKPAEVNVFHFDDKVLLSNFTDKLFLSESSTSPVRANILP